eukprot:gene21985-26480_t
MDVGCYPYTSKQAVDPVPRLPTLEDDTKQSSAGTSLEDKFTAGSKERLSFPSDFLRQHSVDSSRGHFIWLVVLSEGKNLQPFIESLRDVNDMLADHVVPVATTQESFEACLSETKSELHARCRLWQFSVNASKATFWKDVPDASSTYEGLAALDATFIVLQQGYSVAVTILPTVILKDPWLLLFTLLSSSRISIATLDRPQPSAVVQSAVDVDDDQKKTLAEILRSIFWFSPTTEFSLQTVRRLLGFVESTARSSAKWSSRISLNYAIDDMGCQLWSKLCCLPLAERRLVLSGYPPGAPTFQERGFEQHASNNTAQSTTAWLATTRNAIALYMGPQYCLKADLESATLDIDGLRTGLSVVPMPKPLQCGYTRLGSDLDMHFENWHSLDYIPKARNKFTVIITSIHLRRSLYQMNWYSRMHSFIAKIILVWNGREPFPEDALESVKVICTQVFWERDNSLTNRYRHYDAVPTRFVFLTDDDLVLEEKAFSTAYKALLDSPTRIA